MAHVTTWRNSASVSTSPPSKVCGGALPITRVQLFLSSVSTLAGLVQSSSCIASSSARRVVPGAMMPSITECPPPAWDEKQLATLRLEEPTDQPYTLAFSKYNPTPGTGRTGVTAVPPNPFPFYSEAERYVPAIQADGGQLSEWSAMYTPSKEEAEADRQAAYEAGVPHGYKPVGVHAAAEDEFITLRVVSDLHSPSDYGTTVDPKTGRHSGGPFTVQVSLSTRVEQLRTIIRDVGGIIPALQKLSYAGKKLEDSQRTLQQYGVGYWHARFPHWPIKIRCF